MYIQGKQSILYLKFKGIWAPISCETNSGISESSEMLPTTTRDNKGWSSSRVGVQSYTISFSGQTILKGFDEVLSYHKLVEMKRNQELQEWQRRTANRIIETGMAYISELSNAYPAEGLANFEMTLQGVGKPRMIDNANPDAVIVDYDQAALVNAINNAIYTNP